MQGGVEPISVATGLAVPVLATMAYGANAIGKNKEAALDERSGGIIGNLKAITAQLTAERDRLRMEVEKLKAAVATCDANLKTTQEAVAKLNVTARESSVANQLFKRASPETIREAVPFVIENLAQTYPWVRGATTFEAQLEYPAKPQGRLQRLSLPQFWERRLRKALEADRKIGGRGRRRKGGAVPDSLANKYVVLADAVKSGDASKKAELDSVKQRLLAFEDGRTLIADTEGPEAVPSDPTEQSTTASTASRRTSDATGVEADLRQLMNERDAAAAPPTMTDQLAEVETLPPTGMAQTAAQYEKNMPTYEDFEKAYVAALEKSESLTGKRSKDKRQGKRDTIAQTAAQKQADAIQKARENAKGIDTESARKLRQTVLPEEEPKAVAADEAIKSVLERAATLETTLRNPEAITEESWNTQYRALAAGMISEVQQAVKTYAAAIKALKQPETPGMFSSLFKKKEVAAPPASVEGAPAAVMAAPAVAAPAAPAAPPVPTPGTSKWKQWFTKASPEKAPEAAKNQTIHAELSTKPTTMVKEVKQQLKTLNTAWMEARDARDSLCRDLANYKLGPETYDQLTLQLQEAEPILAEGKTVLAGLEKFIKDYKKETKGLAAVTDSSFSQGPLAEAKAADAADNEIKTLNAEDELNAPLNRAEFQKLPKEEQEALEWLGTQNWQKYAAKSRNALREKLQYHLAIKQADPALIERQRALYSTQLKAAEAEFKAAEAKYQDATRKWWKVENEGFMPGDARAESVYADMVRATEALNRANKQFRKLAREEREFAEAAPPVGGAIQSLINLRSKYQTLSETILRLDLKRVQARLEDLTKKMESIESKGPMTAAERQAEDMARATRTPFRKGRPLPLECTPYSMVPKPQSSSPAPVVAATPPPVGVPTPPPSLSDADQTLFKAAASGNLNIATAAVEDGASVTAKNAQGQQPIHVATEAGHDAIVRFLVAKGASITAQDGLLRMPLQLAQEKGHTAIVDYITALIRNPSVPPPPAAPAAAATPAAPAAPAAPGTDPTKAFGPLGAAPGSPTAAAIAAAQVTPEPTSSARTVKAGRRGGRSLRKRTLKKRRGGK